MLYKSGKWCDAFLNTSDAPSGDYKICVTIKDKSGEEVGSNCIDQIIENSSSPSLVSPNDSETISAGRQLVFTWLPPMPASTKKTMFYFGSNITAANWIKFELQGNVSNYKDLSGLVSSYNEAMFQVVALINW